MLDNDTNTTNDLTDGVNETPETTLPENVEQPPVSESVPETKSPESQDESYCVLARKYRPNDFDTLIGQDALVRTLSNALKVGRIAQAFMLTGVRGVGKTTTARIIAKALNCDNVDENNNPPVKPCGNCKNCNDISNGSHIDVVEMDAASHTGIDDIREIIESTQYTPTMGRYKVYILDEVHMLSKNAFNGLLKTLEEPPAHVKFIFATTEIGKVPVTILSRCQRFDLKRINSTDLYNHYSNIAKKEGFEAEDEAIRTIARCADGSVRDGLSILDQALALSENKNITNDLVNSMLGLADRMAIYELFELLLAGDNVNALAKINELYDVGAEPIVVLQELLDISWLLTRFKVNPELFNDPSLPEIEKTKGKEISDKLSIPVLTATWQILNKGLNEIMVAENQLMTLEMIAVRLMYQSELPSPIELAKKLINSDSPAPDGGGDNKPTQQTESVVDTSPETKNESTPEPIEQPSPLVSEITNSQGADFNLTGQTVDEITPPKTFVDFITWVKGKSPILGYKLFSECRPVDITVGKFTINVKLDDKEKRTLYDLLNENFGESVIIEYTNEMGGKTLAELEEQEKQAIHEKAQETELVKSVKQYFPDAQIKKIELTEEQNDVG